MKLATGNRQLHYALDDDPDEEICTILQEIPGRWGRMTPLSRAVVVEAGRLLQQTGLLVAGRHFNIRGKKVGLVGATRRGSLAVDQEFAGSMAENPQLASPALFGYTLANIPLAEAANHYGLVGPVFALYSTDDPLKMATLEAKRWLAAGQVDLMLACEFDDLSHNDDLALTVDFAIVAPV